MSSTFYSINSTGVLIVGEWGVFLHDSRNCWMSKSTYVNLKSIILCLIVLIALPTKPFVFWWYRRQCNIGKGSKQNDFKFDSLDPAREDWDYYKKWFKVVIQLSGIDDEVVLNKRRQLCTKVDTEGFKVLLTFKSLKKRFDFICWLKNNN